MMGTFQPSWRAWTTMPEAFSTSAETIRISGFWRLERGELGGVVPVRLGEGLGADDLDRHGLERALHDVVAGLGEGVVVAVEQAGLLEAELALERLSTPGMTWASVSETRQM